MPPTQLRCLPSIVTMHKKQHSELDRKTFANDLTRYHTIFHGWGQNGDQSSNAYFEVSVFVKDSRCGPAMPSKVEGSRPIFSGGQDNFWPVNDPWLGIRSDHPLMCTQNSVAFEVVCFKVPVRNCS
jgi:hypothetical protein